MLEDTNSLDAAHIPALASVNNNKKCAIGRSENERKSVLWGKMFIFVVAYMNMINDVGNLT